MEKSKDYLRSIEGGKRERAGKEAWFEKMSHAIVGHEKALGFTEEEFDDLDQVIHDFEVFIEKIFDKEAKAVDELCSALIAGVLNTSQFNNKMRDIFPRVRGESAWQAEVRGGRTEPAGGADMVEDTLSVYEGVLLAQFHTHAQCVRRYNEMISKIGH